MGVFGGVVVGSRPGDTPSLGVLGAVGVSVGVLIGDCVTVGVGVVVVTGDGVGWTVGTLVAVGVGTPTEVTLASSQAKAKFLPASTPALHAAFVQDPASARFAVYVNS
jgi:hypothetical protein